MIAFFDEPNSKLFGGRRSVSFTIEGRSCLGIRHRIEVVINQISWEDGSGESWTFTGYCTTDVGQPSNEAVDVNGWFRTSDRKGWIDINAPYRAEPG
jgi:hypothetical protein